MSLALPEHLEWSAHDGAADRATVFADRELACYAVVLAVLVLSHGH